MGGCHGVVVPVGPEKVQIAMFDLSYGSWVRVPAHTPTGRP